MDIEHLKSSIRNIPDYPKPESLNFFLKSNNLTKENINKSDLLLLATDHDAFEYKLIEKEAKLIIDTRGRFIYNKSPEKIINA